MVEGLRGKKIVHVAVGALHCLAVTDTGQVCTDLHEQSYKPEHIVQTLCSFTAMALFQICEFLLPSWEVIYRLALYFSRHL